ncbi:MAG TPA: mechanosensitive ion channel family protein [Thiobacillaceae bacterium]|nr:mechanosensitive ion channel family protein [Thiobacillaceae bacterium]
MQEQLDTLGQVQSTAIELAMQFGPRLLVALLILAAGYFVARWVGRVAEKMLLRLELEPPVRELLVRILGLLVLAMFLVLALQNLGVELLPLIAGLGVAGAGIALAMQGVLANIVAGLTIIFTRPYRVGEYISIAEEEGEVRAINLFTTTLGHYDQSHVVIPNRKIVGEILHNYGLVRQLNVVVGVAYDTDMERALAIVDGVLAAEPRVLREPPPLVQVSALSDSSVNIAVRPWVGVADYPLAVSAVNRAVLEAFRRGGVAIPFPQREVRLLGQPPVTAM